MVRKFDSSSDAIYSNSIRADVIVLGCTLPGIVTAHKLKRKFGNSMDIIVLDLTGAVGPKTTSKCNVSFHETDNDYNERAAQYNYTARQLLDNVARFYLIQYSREFQIPLPEAIINPVDVKTTEVSLELEDESRDRISLQKVFQYPNGSTVQFLNNVHDFEYLSFLEKFELNQYQAFLDKSMEDLFQTNKIDLEEERTLLMYYDRTTMEKNICETLLFSTSREIMRIIVRLVCGAPAKHVSLLFYLHQCYRTSSTKNHLGGLNTRFREKLLGHCRKRLASKLQQSVADITTSVKNIKGIRTYSEQVILETIKGETTYICNLLAMALKPEQLTSIQVEDQLLSEENVNITKRLTPGCVKKFSVHYKENFWTKQGYSGDIFSMRGPIIWAMEKPKYSNTGSLEKYAVLTGYLMIRDDMIDSKEAVLEQLTKMFGMEAAYPVSYKESIIADIYVPRCGDYVALRKMTAEGSPRLLEWGALDIFAEGDVAAALEAGHTAYLHLLGCLRPQAQTYDDFIASEWPTLLSESPVNRWMSQINVISSLKITVCTVTVFVGISLLRSFIRR